MVEDCILRAADPDAWRSLPQTAAPTVFFSANFAESLRPAFVDIPTAFYTFEYRLAVERCGIFFGQLTAAKHHLGAQYDCTVASYCFIRVLLHKRMGFLHLP